MTPRIAAVFCVYNEEEYLGYAVKAILPAVDHVIICLSEAPYTAYRAAADGQFPPDQTAAIIDELVRAHPSKIQVLRGRWANQIEHRAAGLRQCLALGAEYYFLVDGDEVYRADHLDRLRTTLRQHPEVGTWIIKCHTFWRSFRYRIPADLLTWRPRRIFKLTTSRRAFGIFLPYRLRFTGINDLNSLGPVVEIPSSEVAFYHFSYARSPRRMYEKLSTFPHAHQILEGWYHDVWLAWPEHRQQRDIHPTDPPKFPQAVYHDPADLPTVMQQHPYWPMDIIDDP